MHALAQDVLRPRRGEDTAASRPYTLISTFSGGISLGAYQAGVNWAMMEALRASRYNPAFRQAHGLQDLHFGAAAGASAGNINAIIWAVEACSAVQPGRGPQESLFWKTWMPVGIDSLLRGEPFRSSDDLALLDRRFFGTVQDTLQSRIAATPFRGGCEVPVGITLTRVIPEVVTLKYGLQVRTQRFVTLLTARSADGAGAPSRGAPFVFHTVLPSPALLEQLGRVRLAQRDTAVPVAMNSLFTIVRASSAFPVAFAPVEMALYNPESDSARNELFADGGVFDNNPIDLANLLQDWIETRDNPRIGGKAPPLPPPPGPVAGAQGVRDLETAPKSRRLLYVDPDVRREVSRASPRHSLATLRERRPVPGGLRSVLQLLSGSVDAAREYELSALGRHADGRTPFELARTTRHYPLVGERMGAFAAFLNRGFREYDFYIGAYDALVSLTRDPAFTLRARPRRDCDRVGWMDDLAAAIGMPLHGRAFIRSLANDELGCQDAFSPLEVTGDGEVRLGFYRLVLEAQETGASNGAAPDCEGRTVPEWILCTGEMEVVLDSVRSGIGGLPGYARACQPGRGEARPGRGSAWVELELCDLARTAPGDRMQELIERVLARMPAMEREAIHREGKDTPDAAPSRLAETGSELAGFLYYSGVRPLVGLQWGSLPRGSSWAWRLIPAYLGTDGDFSAVEVGWQPTYYLPSSPGVGLGATVITRVNWFTDRTAPDPEVTAWGTAGFGPRITYRVTSTFGFLASRVDVAALTTTRGWMAESAVGLFADRLRLAMRVVDGGRDLADGGELMFTIGLNDLPGLAYWVTQISGH
jgi:predicted acylesterase/phospholipase RssA